MAGGSVKEKAAYVVAQPAVPALEGEEAAFAPAGRRVFVTVLADVVAILVADLLTIGITRWLTEAPSAGRVFGQFDVGPNGGALTVLLLIPWWLFVLYAFGLYRQAQRSIGGSSFDEAMRGLTALTVGAWLLTLALLVIEGDDMSLGFVLVFWAAAAVTIPSMRWISRAVVWSGDTFAERTVIIGAGSVGHTLAAKIDKHPEYHLRLVGFLDDGEPLGRTNSSVPVIGHLSDLDAVIRERDVSRVIIAFSRARHQQILSVVRTCAEYGVRVNIVPRLFEILSSQMALDDIEGIPLLDVANVELSRFNMFVKRVFDLVVGGLIFVITLPVITILAVLVKLDSPGPVFYRQPRAGRGGREFRIFKMRSMYIDAEKRRKELAAQNEYSGPMFKIKQDPRITRLGAVMRRWSLDELPQIFNVLLGDMSLVGPRPLWVEEARQCRGWTRKRLDITPGITGLWQVLGRNDIPFDEMVKLDYMYVTGWTLSWDVKLLAQTVPAVLGRRGAY
jgi:exopolysaccharide biosynthesis polyprenyl glycosylphosphotransferase